MNVIYQPKGALVLRLNEGAAALVYSMQDQVAGQVTYMREKMMQRGDDHQAFANLGATLIKELKTEPPDGDVVRALAAAVVYAASVIADVPEANCMVAYTAHVYAPPGTQIGTYDLANCDPSDFLACELQSIDRTFDDTPASTGITLPQLMSQMVEEAETFWATTQTGEMWPPRIIASTCSGLIYLECPQYDPEYRDAILAGLRQRLRQVGADSYVLAAETWMGESGSPLAPSQQASRREVMLVCAADKDGNTDVAMFEMVRDATGRVTKLAPARMAGEKMGGPLLELLQ